MPEPTTDLSLTLERTFNADISRVFDAWASKDIVCRWMGPSDDYTCEVHEWDFREGGSYRLTMHHVEGGKPTVHGVFTGIDRPNRIAMTWAWETDEPGGEHETQVLVELASNGERTDLKLTHSGFESIEMRDGHNRGWSGTMERFARAIAD